MNRCKDTRSRYIECQQLVSADGCEKTNAFGISRRKALPTFRTDIRRQTSFLNYRCCIISQDNVQYRGWLDPAVCSVSFKLIHFSLFSCSNKRRTRLFRLSLMSSLSPPPPFSPSPASDVSPFVCRTLERDGKSFVYSPAEKGAVFLFSRTSNSHSIHTK